MSNINFTYNSTNATNSNIAYNPYSYTLGINKNLYVSNNVNINGFCLTGQYLIDPCIPNNNEPYNGYTYTISDKYLFKDGTSRTYVYPIEDISNILNYFQTEGNNVIYQISGNNYIGFNYPNLGVDSTILQTNINNTYNNPYRLDISNNFDPSYNLISWGPSVLDQGQLGSCYANSACIVAAYTEAFYQQNLNQIIDISSQILINSLLPSRAYLEYVYQKWNALYNNNSSVFDQGGLGIIALYNAINLSSGFPLEVSYSYPLLANFLNNNSLTSVSSNCQNYLIEEFFRKKLYPPDQMICELTAITPYYKNISVINVLFSGEIFDQFNMAYNSLYGLSQATNNNGDLIYYDLSGNVTTNQINSSGTFNYGIPLYTWQQRVNLYKTYINNNYAIGINVVVSNVWMNNVSSGNNSGNFITPPISTSDMNGGHAITIVGWDDTILCPDNTTGVFLIQNSWGTNTGMSGYFYLPYSYITWFLSIYGISSGYLGFLSAAFTVKKK